MDAIRDLVTPGGLRSRSACKEASSSATTDMITLLYSDEGKLAARVT